MCVTGAVLQIAFSLAHTMTCTGQWVDGQWHHPMTAASAHCVPHMVWYCAASLWHEAKPLFASAKLHVIAVLSFDARGF